MQLVVGLKEHSMKLELGFPQVMAAIDGKSTKHSDSRVHCQSSQY